MKIVYSILLMSLVAVSASATKRTTAQMEQIARQKLGASASATQTRAAGASQISRTLSTEYLSVYSDGLHYVIISRDDSFPPVLAYGAGVFNPDSLPDGTAWWFDAVKNSLASPMKSIQRRPSKISAVAPLMTTKWGQGIPYNNYAPIFKKDKTKAPAGCVATAMSQVMNFNRYPASVAFTGSYSVSDDKEQIEAEVSRTYTWPYLDAYNYYFPEGASEYVRVSNTPRQGNQVAYLMLDCGYAVGMMYNPSGSGAYTMEAALALIEKFKYNEIAVRYYNRAFYSTEEWMTIIYGELANGYPFIYAGSDANGGGGHAFVADGVDENGLLHINWGWSGSSDGYYAFDLLNPDDMEFSRGQEIVTGIRPATLEGDQYGSLLATASAPVFSYNNETKMLTIEISGIYNYCGKPIVGSAGVAIEHQTNPDFSVYIDFLADEAEEEGEEVTLLPYWGWNADKDSVELELKPGQYRIFMGSKDKRESQWQIARTYGGEVYYDMSVDEAGKVTIAESPVNTDIKSISVERSSSLQKDSRIYDLSGRQVTPAGLRKGIYIIGGRKVVK